MPDPITRLYSFLPSAIQNGIVTLYGSYWKRRRFGGIFQEELENFRSYEYFSKSLWQEYQTRELRRLLIHAFETVPFYKGIYTAAGITRDQLRHLELEDIACLPVLLKDDLRKYGTSELLSTKRKKGGRFYSSSGSTGTPTKILFSNEMHQRWSAAFEARIRNWAGLSHNDSRGMIGGRRVVPDGTYSGPYHRYNRAERQIYFSAYHISPETAADYASALIKYKPAYMTGYAMSNYLLASFFDDRKIDVPPLKAVITSSEKLTPEMRDLFRKVYGCKTFDSYSGVEACGLISENEYGQLLVSPDVGIMEILNKNGQPSKPGEVGEIYSTGLLNYDQPLIRYRIGDKVRLAKDQKTLCGRNMTVIDEIIGRDEDVVQGPDGRQMVRFHGLYVDIKGLVAGQLVQHEPDMFTINLQTDKTGYERSAAEKIIEKRLISQLGAVRVIFEYPEKIPPGPNGKFKAVISESKDISV